MVPCADVEGGEVLGGWWGVSGMWFGAGGSQKSEPVHLVKCREQARGLRGDGELHALADGLSWKVMEAARSQVPGPR